MDRYRWTLGAQLRKVIRGLPTVLRASRRSRASTASSYHARGDGGTPCHRELGNVRGAADTLKSARPRVRARGGSTMPHGVVSRPEESRAVADFLSSAATGPSVLLMEGELGIGKTTLWRVVLEQARH